MRIAKLAHRSGLALLGLALAALPASAASPTFTVKYRSASYVYLEGGRDQGLVEGDRLAVVAGRKTVAELEVVFLADRSASCRVLSEQRTVREGDTAVLLRKTSEAPSPTATAEPQRPAPVVPPPVPPAPPVEPARRVDARPWARLRGGASLGLYRSWDQTPTGLDFRQTTARLDLGLWDLFGQPLSLDLRFRSRRDVRARALSTRTPKEQREDRLYELSLRYEPPSERVAFEVGRLGASPFVGVGYLDGALGRVQVAPRLQLGGFFGQRVDLGGFESGASGQKYGGFLRIAPSGRYATGSYDAVLAVVREFASDEISREYVSLESRLGSGRRWSFFERAELDLNRDWRRDLTGTDYQLSLLSLAANLRVSPAASFSVSYDSRRNYRDHLNQDVPEAIFDEALHRGLRASFFLGQPGGFAASGGFGVQIREQDQQNTYSANLGVRHHDLWSRDISASLDATGFSNLYTEGYLATLRGGKRFARRHSLDLSYGQSLYRVKATQEKRATHWLRLLGRAELTGGLYLLGDLEYDAGDDLEGPRAFLEVGYQF